MSRNTVGLPDLSGKTDSRLINKDQDTEFILAIRNMKLDTTKNKNSFIISIPKVLHGKFPMLQLQHFGYTQAIYRLCKLRYIMELSE